MVSRREPDFEPMFGSLSTTGSFEPRLRDRHLGSDDDDGDGSIGELLDDLDAHRSRSDDPTPAGRLSDGPVIPAAADAASSSTAGNQQRVGTWWFRFRRRLVVVCALAILAALAYFVVTLIQVWSTGRADDEGPADAIVVMGAAQYDGRPSPQLAARLDHALELWPSGVAPLVVVTGGNLPGDRFTEAEASASYLVDRGIPEESIVLENGGATSQESLTAVADMLTARGLDEVVIVTDPYHAMRSRLIAEEAGLDAGVSSTDTSVVTGFDSFERHVVEAGGVAVGRIIGFDRLADLTD